MTQPDALRWIFEVEKRDIAYIVGVFEGYDDIAIVRTIDAARGRIELSRRFESVGIDAIG